MANEVLKCLTDLYKLAGIKDDDYTTQGQISGVICNIEALLIPSNGVAPSRSDLDVYLNYLFNPENGLPVFINKYFYIKTILPCLQSMFQLILALLDNYVGKVIKYAVVIKDVCMKGILSGDTSMDCKKSCYSCLQRLITHCSLHSAFNAETISNQLFNLLALSQSKLNIQELENVYTLLGLLGRHFSVELCAPDKLIRALCNELNSKENKEGKHASLVRCCLTALSDLLSNSEFEALIQSSSNYHSKIYKALKSTITHIGGRSHVAFRAALKLFSDHTELWAPLVVPEYSWWHSKLTELLAKFENEEDKRALEEAIDKFYVLVAKFVRETRSSESVVIYKHFMDYFIQEMSTISTLHSTSESGRQKITIKGLSCFVECSVANNQESQEHLATMFDSFLQRTLFLSLELQKLESSTLDHSARLVSNYLLLLFKLQASLSQISPTSGSGEMGPKSGVAQSSTQSSNSLLHICINLVTLYPRLDYTSRVEVSQELTEAWATLYSAGLGESLLGEFVYQSVIRACSHDLLFDADNLPDLGLVTFRMYLPLWQRLLSRAGVSSAGKTFADFILDQLLSCLVLLCHKLDLRADLKPDSELSGSAVLPSLSHAYLRDPASHLSPSNQTDLALFTNLVDFYSHLLATHPPAAAQSRNPDHNETRNVAQSDDIVAQNFSQNITESANPHGSLDNDEYPSASDNEEPDVIGNVTQSNDLADSSIISPCKAVAPGRLVSVLKEVIAASRKHPVMGGLYSLSALLLRLSRDAHCFQDPLLVEDVSPLMSCYLDQAISVSIHQQQELRGACLSLVLATPLCFIRPLLPRLVQPLQIIFQLGLSDLDLAESGLAALTHWVALLPPHVTRPLVAPLLPALGPYLRARDSSEESLAYSDTDRALLSTGLKPAQRKNKRKLIESCEENSQLRSLQTSIVYFLSMVGSNPGLEIVSAGENCERLSERITERLLFHVPFLTSKVPIHFDIFMDHLVSLASSSSNRRLRVAACEFLHCTTLLLLGNNKQDGSRKGNEGDEMFEKILPVVIKLGCDGDILVRQLFSDLATQLMHYYSSELQLYTSHAQHVITTLMDNITQDSQSELRDFSSRLLAEFLVWTRKQSPKFSDPTRSDTKLNMAAVVKQIQQYCVHPAASKRIGAAIAFNGIYQILREENSFIDKHWLDLYFHFVQNLALCPSAGHNQIICESFNHLNRVVKEKSQLFNVTNANRSKPNRFESLTLGSFLCYLCEHLNHANVFLRSAVRKIIAELSPHAAAGFKLETELPAIHTLVQAQLTDGSGVRAVNIALENYLWLVGGKQHAKTTTNLLLAPHSKLLPILNSQLKYLHDPPLMNKFFNLKASAGDFNLDDVRELIVSLLKLTIQFDADTMRELFDPSVSGEEAMPSNRVINRHYFRLVSKCLFQPHVFGFNPEQREDLRTIMDRLLCDKCRALNDVAKVLFEMLYRDYVHVDAIYDHITEPYRLRQQRVEDRQRSYLEALTLIQKSGLFPFYIECINSSMIDSLFDSLFESSQLTSELTPDLKEYSQLLYEFLNASPQDMRKVVDCAVDARPYLNVSSKNPKTKGQHFFSLHRPILTRLLLNHLNQLESLLLMDVTYEKIALLTQLVEAVTCPSRDTDNSYKLSNSASSLLFSSCVLSHWSCLVSLLTTDHLVTLLSHIVLVKPHCGYLAEFDQVVEWYLGVLKSSSSRFQDKLHYLKFLPSFLTNTMTSSETVLNKDQISTLVEENPSPVDKNPSTDEKSPSTDDKIPSACEISLESQLLSTIQSLLSSLSPQDGSVSTDDSTCHFLLMCAELQKALTRCLNWGLFNLVAESSCHYSVLCDREKKENRLDFVACLPQLLAALSPAHHTPLAHTLYALLTRPYVTAPFLAQSSVTQSSVTQSGVTQSRVTQSKGTRFRHAWLDVVFLPTLREMFRQSSACAAFYQGRMELIRAALEAEIPEEVIDEADVRSVEEALLRKLIHVRLMEGILHVPSAELSESLENERKQIMKSCVYSNLLKCNRRFDQSDYCSLLNRELHTAAYVACCIWICNTGTHIRSYSLLFKEQPGADRHLFRHLLPPGRDFHFPMEFSVLPQQKRLLTGIRCGRQQQQEEVDRYRTSVDLFSSSLADDVFGHDFTSTRVLVPPCPPQPRPPSLLALTLELDEINSHEAMQAVTAALRHLRGSDLFRAPDALDPEPLWLREFLSSLQSPAQPRPVRVWLLKLVVNCRDLFSHYAETLYPALIQTITAGTLGSHISYFLNDLLLTLLSWHTTSLPPSHILRDFLAFMFQIIPHANTSIRSYNLDMIKNMLSVWSPKIGPHEIPHETLLSMVSNPDPLIQETGLALSELVVSILRLQPFSESTHKQTMTALMGLVTRKEDKSGKAGASKKKSSGGSDVLAKLIGAVLSTFKSPEEAGPVCLPDKYDFQGFMRHRLGRMAKKLAEDTGPFLRMLYFVSASYPPIVDGFLNEVISIFPKLPKTSKHKEHCLSLLGSVYTRSNVADMWTVLKQLGVLEILNNMQHGLLLPMLSLLSSVKHRLSPAATSSLLPSIARHAASSQPLVRTRVYELVFHVFDAWVLNEEERMEVEGEERGDLVEVCKELVLKGLLDEDQTLQDQNYSRLTEHYQSTPPAELIPRLLRDLYVPSMEAHLLNFVSYFILDSTRNSADFSTPLFPHPLEACSYRQLRLLLSHRHRHLSHAPLFITSLASQVLGLTDAAASMGAPGSAAASGSTGPSGQYRFELRGSGSGAGFEPTADSKQGAVEQSVDAASPDDKFLFPSPPDSLDSADETLTRNRFFQLSLRFRRNHKEHQKKEAMKRHGSLKFKRIGLNKDKQRLKGAQVSLSRPYRTGDFPDIQIRYEAVLGPLKALCVRDAALSRLLVLSLYRPLSQQSAALRETSGAQFKQILEQGVNDPNMTSLILEIFCEQDRDDVTNVNQVAKTSGLIHHGIWFTENKLLANIPNSNKITAHFGSVFPTPYSESVVGDEEPGGSSKRFKRADESLINAAYTELIDLYKNIDESDIINGILAQQHSTNLRRAIDAELSNNFRRARKHYELCLGEGGVLSTAIIRDGYYRTFHEMSKWSELEVELAKEVEGDWHNVWTKDRHVMNHLLRSQIFKKREAHVTSISASEQSKDAFLSAFKVWTESNPDHFDSLKLHHAQDTSILHLLLSRYPQAVSLAELNLNQQLLRWRFSGSAAVLDNALVAMETALVSKTLGSGSHGDVARLSHVWDLSCSEREELATLELRVALRSAFIEQVETSEYCDAALRADLAHRHILNQLRLIDAALRRRSFYLARDRLGRLLQDPRCWQDEAQYGQVMKLYTSRVDLALCREQRSVEQKLDKLLDTWKSLEDPGDYEMQDLLKVQFYRHVGELGAELLSCLRDPAATLNTLRRDTLHDVLVPYGAGLSGDCDAGQVQAAVFHVVVDGLRKTIVNRGDLELGDEVCSSNGECHLLLAEFIRCQSGVDAAFPASSAYTQSLLRSIQCGTVKARQLFPLLLQMPDILQHGETFSDIVRDIPSWMFLLWLNQILAYLDQDIGPLLLPIVQRLATEYPHAVKLPFNINAERYKLSSDPALQSLIKQLKFSPQEDNLYTSLSVCTLPVSMLKHHLEHIYTLDKGNLKQLQAAVQALHDDCFISRPAYNEAIVDYCAKYRRSVGEVFHTVQAGLPDPQLNDKLRNLLGKIAKEESKKRSWELKQVSRYLSSYGLHGDEVGLEVPGQYGGLSCPRPEQHVKVAQFRQNIRVMQSLKKPIQLTIVGNNGEEYPWLVKHNEDLRSDERIQAVFSLYNSGLRTVSRGGNRELSLVTYRVVPLRPNSGMIQWVPHTRVLGELYQTKGLTKEWLLKHLAGPYQKFHENKSEGPAHIVYEKSMQQKTRQEVTANFVSLANKLPKFELRDGLLCDAKSPESRVRLRNNFVHSYAAMCIAHYTLGIGDRHLENTLVCSLSGRCIGIDFGMAFGVATQLLPIPELVPFRLTPHVLAVNAPYGSGGLIRESMVRVLSCLRSHSDVILCTLQVFIREPCSDWLVMLRRKLARDGDLTAREIEERGDAYMQGYSEARVRVAEQKLAGHSSTYVMNQELELRAASSRLVCSRLVSGPLDSARNIYNADTKLSVGDQVDCLLDHATDPGILGVTWVGWAPYV